MEDLNRKKSSKTSIIAIVILALVLGFGAYTFTKNKMATPPAETPAQTAAIPEETTPPAESATAPTEAAPEVVVETKKLDITAPDAPPPSAANSDPKIVAMMAQRSIGEASAPVKITEYSSLSCPHCATFHRENFEKFKSQFIDTGKVQMAFKEFPLNQPAMDGSLILRCMPEDKYVSFMNLLFQEQEKWAFDANYKDFLRQNAKLAGMSDESFDICLANTALKEAILGDMKAAGDQYKVQSTPSFVFSPGNKVLVGNQPIEEFAKAVDEAAASPASTPATTPAPEATAPAPAETTTTDTAPEAAAAGAAVDATGAAPEVSEETAPPAE